MSLATLYSLVVLLHLSADIVFVASLLAGSLVLAALSLQPAAEMARSHGLVVGMRRWHRAVTTPALLVVWACGLWLAWRAGWFASGWLHAKLALVLVLSGLHGMLSAALRRASAASPAIPSRAWRVLPAIALVIAAVVVWLALMKPF
jgi:putative membrane protein